LRKPLVTSSVVAGFVGVSGRILEKIAAVMEAAEKT
jgi:hypothetical protein